MKDVTILTSNGINVEKSLELLGDMDMYNETMQDFLAGVDEKITNLKQYRELGDMENYAIIVHSLKSDAKYLGFVSLAELAYQFELKSKANDLIFVRENYLSLLEETKRIVMLCKRYLGNNDEVIVIDTDVNINKEDAILVVDDSNLVANFIKKVFDNKYEVLIANDGAAAIEYVSGEKASKIVACLLDLNMPNVNGFAVLEFFKTNNLFTKIPVSIITGNDTKDQVSQAFDYPIVDLLSKPFNERDVQRIIEKTISFHK